MSRSFIVCAILFSSFFAGICFAYPKPAIAPRAHHWNLDVEYSKPYQVKLNIPGDPADAPPRRFWYIVLTLTNNTGRDVPFYSSCDLMTDTFRIIPSGKNVMNIVFEKIKLIQQGRYPFLERLEDIPDKILQGEDNSVDVAVIWPDFDPEARMVDLFIAGLSNEVAAVTHPFKKDKNGNPVKLFLSKTLQLKYSIAGDPKFRDEDKMKYITRKWVMR